MFEMRFGASVWEKYQTKNEMAQSATTMIPTGRRNDQAARSVTNRAEQSIPGSAANETGLVAKRSAT